MPTCAVPNCRNKHSANPDLSFHRFPIWDENLLEKWMIAVNVHKVTKFSRICSSHFTEDSFYDMQPWMTRKRLKPGIVPLKTISINSQPSQPHTASASPSKNIGVHSAGCGSSVDQVLWVPQVKKPKIESPDQERSTCSTPVVEVSVSWESAAEPKTLSVTSPLTDVPLSQESVSEMTVSSTPTPISVESATVPVIPSAESTVGHKSSKKRAVFKVTLTRQCCTCRATLMQQNLKIRSLQRQVRQLQQKIANLTSSLSFLKKDQIAAMQIKEKTGNNAGVVWSTETVRLAFQIRFLTGVHGYQFLRGLGYPLPAYRTLCSRVQHAEFQPGIQYDIISWLSDKISSMQEQEKDVVLMLDEMQVSKQLEYDKGLNMFLGSVSEQVSIKSPDTNDSVALASHALVYMIRGLTSNWKQVVAYYLTDVTVLGDALWQITKSLITLLGNHGINVRAVVSDMGAANQAMWKVAGVKVNRATVKSSISHPVFMHQDLYFFADVPHLLKNIRNCLLTNDIILPSEVVSEFCLPTNTVSVSHIRKIVELQENADFKIAPSLSHKHVDPKQFEKMKVNTAAQLLSHSTASAIRYAVHDNLLPPDALTTAWFVDTINSWFDAANARSRSEAIYAKSGDKIRSLLLMIELVPKLCFSSAHRKSSWKPIQTGILLSTQSMLDLFASLVASNLYTYLLTSRLTQDALENLFSQIRGRGNAHPSPVHFRQCLRLISISQFLAIPKHSSYNISECDFAVSFLKPKSRFSNQVQTSSVTSRGTDPISSEVGNQQLPHSVTTVLHTSSEKNAIYYLTGWLAFKLKKQLKSCDACISFLVSSDQDDQSLPQAKLTVTKSLGWLTIPSKSLQNFILAAEMIFQHHRAECLSSSNALQLLLEKCTNLLTNSDIIIPACHNVGHLIMRKFFRLRLHICAATISKPSKNERQYGSKSAKSRTTVK